MDNMLEEMNVVRVKKSISPFAIVGIIVLVLVFAFGSTAIVLSLLGGDSYKTAELKYFANAAKVMGLADEKPKTAEFEVEFSVGEAAEYFGALGSMGKVNNTIIKGAAGIDGTDMNCALNWYNGDKKLLGLVTILDTSHFKVAFPEISNVLISSAMTQSSGKELDRDELMKTLKNIADKYFELVGEPEVVEESYVLEENGLEAKCVWYQLRFDAEFAYLFSKYVLEQVLENENLTDFIGEGTDEQIETLLKGWEMPENTEGEIVMDVYAQNNNIIKRTITVEAPGLDSFLLDIITIEEGNDGYSALVMSSNTGDITLTNEYEKSKGKYSGELELSMNFGYSMALSGSVLEVNYSDVEYNETYGFLGEFELAVPSTFLEVKGESALEGGKCVFDFDIEYGDETLLGIGGNYSIRDGVDKSLIPDLSRFKEFSTVDYNAELADELSQDFMKFFQAGIGGEFADANGNYDIIGLVLQQLYTTMSAYGNNFLF